MAKKSSKSTRRSRAKKEVVSKKQVTPAATNEEAVIIAEGSDEPVVKEVKEPAAKKAVTKKSTIKKEPTQEESIEPTVDAEAQRQSVEEMVRPQRKHMLVSAAVLAVVIVASIATASFIRSANAPSAEPVAQQSDKTITDPDKLLESGGKVCTNGSTQTNTQGSANPNTVGMMLQSVPSQQIQTPQTLSGGNDAATLQGASCY